MRRVLAAALALVLSLPLAAQAQEERDPAMASLGPNCKEDYEAYILGPYPRAFAQSPDKRRCGYATGGDSRQLVEATALKSCGPTCTVTKRSPEVQPDDKLTPAEMRPAQRDPTSRYRGPKEAVGVLIWSPGSTPNALPSRNSTAAFVRTFNEAKWDVWRVDRTEPGQNTLKGAQDVLSQAIEKVKGAGYQRIVLAGQSAGGFISLILAARRTDIEAAIATAPAIRGDMTEKKVDDLQRALKEFDAVLSVRKNPATRLAVALFSADPFEPSAVQRGTIIERRAKELGWPILLIDRPEGLIGHDAGRGVPFAIRHRDCLLRFVELPKLEGGMHDCNAILRAPR